MFTPLALEDVVDREGGCLPTNIYFTFDDYSLSLLDVPHNCFSLGDLSDFQGDVSFFQLFLKE